MAWSEAARQAAAEARRGNLFYHGTNRKNFKSIARTGILPSAISHYGFKKANLVAAKQVSLTRDLSVVKHFADREEIKGGVVFRVKMPSRSVKEASGGWGGHVLHEGPVSVKNIRAVAIYNKKTQKLGAWHSLIKRLRK